MKGQAMTEKQKELEGKLQERQAKMAGIFEEAGPENDMDKVKSLEGDSTAKVDQIKQLNDELTDLGSQLAEEKNLSDIKARNDKLGEVEKHPGFGSNGRKEAADSQNQNKSIGELVTESDAFKQKGVESEIKVGLKTTFAETGGSIAYTPATAGWFPMDERRGTFVEYALARTPLRVADLIPHTTTSAQAVTWWVESAFTNAAVEVAEGAAKPEAALAVTTATELVKKIAAWIPVTDEQIADVPQVRGYLDNRLGFMINLRLNQQLLTGNGAGANFTGILNRSGLQAAQAKGADSIPAAIYKEMTKIRINNFTDPTGIVMHPTDWQSVRLLTTADGIFIWGAPSGDAPETIWGLPVAQTTLMTVGTALVGDFSKTELAVREGLTVRVTDSHASLFISNIQVVLVEFRAAFIVYQPGAFGTVTGL